MPSRPQVTHEAKGYVKVLDKFIDVKMVDGSPAVLSLGRPFDEIDTLSLGNQESFIR